jgi:hypothetical protein
LVKKFRLTKNPLSPANLKDELGLPFSILKVKIDGDSRIEFETKEDVSDAIIEQYREVIINAIRQRPWKVERMEGEII